MCVCVCVCVCVLIVCMHSQLKSQEAVWKRTSQAMEEALSESRGEREEELHVDGAH